MSVINPDDVVSRFRPRWAWSVNAWREQFTQHLRASGVSDHGTASVCWAALSVREARLCKRFAKASVAWALVSVVFALLALALRIFS